MLNLIIVMLQNKRKNKSINMRRGKKY